MRYLLISLSALLISCASYPKRNNLLPTTTFNGSISNTYFSESAKDYVYRADIKLLKKNLSGILIVKKLGEHHHRVVFTTEMGNKIFDLSFFKKSFKVNYVLPNMDKGKIVRLLGKDFRALVTENPFCTAIFKNNRDAVLECTINDSKYYYYSDGQKLNKLVRTDHGQESVIFLFSVIVKNKANHIKITHKKIDLDITLKAI